LSGATKLIVNVLGSAITFTYNKHFNTSAF
jgi:hypothetical protein